ncbi:Tumor necrosis factor alpha-induced protein 8-like protein, partial [Stegodyphus mimosarum]
MANKSIAKVFIDDTTGNLLDNLYRLGRAHSGNKKEA